jgi:hypothetical protein
MGAVLVSTDCRSLKRALRPLVWVTLEEVALEAVADDNRFVARTSARQVAEHLGVDPGTAAGALRVLRQRGLLVLEREKGPAGRFGLSVYALGSVAGLTVVAPYVAEPWVPSPLVGQADVAEPATAAPYMGPPQPEGPEPVAPHSEQPVMDRPETALPPAATPKMVSSYKAGRMTAVGHSAGRSNRPDRTGTTGAQPAPSAQRPAQEALELGNGSS